MTDKRCVLVSACLLGENCKYNGKNNYNQDVIDYVADKEVIPICPEILAGLPTPREPAELKDGCVYNISGQNIHEIYEKGVTTAMDIIVDQKIDLAILQSRSPSCGVNQVYDGTFRGKKVAGRGLFAQVLLKEGYHVVDAEDINKMKH